MGSSPIKQIQVGQYNGYILTYKSSKLQIISDLGCNPNILILDGQEVLDGNTTPEDLKNHFISKGDFLAPFPNRISDGKYTFNAVEHQLAINEPDRGHALHGLIVDKKFTLQSSAQCEDGASASFITKISADEFPGYPFDLEITITFTLKARELAIDMSGKNRGTIDAPFGVGWHPYFTARKRIDDLYLTLPAASILETDKVKELIPTGKKLPNEFGTNKRTIQNTFFDTCFTDLEKHSVLFENIELFMDNQMKFVQFYTPDERTSIAIEPMSCAPDAFNNGMGLHILKPDESVMHSFSIRIH